MLHLLLDSAHCPECGTSSKTNWNFVCLTVKNTIFAPQNESIINNVQQLIFITPYFYGKQNFKRSS